MGAQPAAAAVQMLAQQLLTDGGRAGSWAPTAGCELMNRVLATPNCPAVVRQAAMQGLQHVRPPVPQNLAPDG